ncbi:hypothetical protein M1D97_00455 [Kushneria sp. AK178]
MAKRYMQGVAGTACGLAVLTLTACSAPHSRDTLTAQGFDTRDDTFATPYIDTDERRTEPVPHRYVHGGFKGTDTRFSYYFPPREDYEGRFFQHVTPTPISETLAREAAAGADNKIGFSADSGAYFVETNGGGQGQGNDPTLAAYRANAAAARFSRHVARQVYTNDERPWGYVYGGSGGAFRTIGSLENTDVWDGGVPYVLGSPMAIPNMFTVRMQALRVLDDQLAQVVDAVDPGGSGDPYAGLTEREAEVLREADRMGFPLKSWYAYESMGLHGFAALYQGVRAADAAYFEDFWTQPGYLGHDHPDYFDEARIEFASTVAEPITRREAHDLGLMEAPTDGDAAGGVDNAFEGEASAEDIVGFRLEDTPPDVTFVAGDLDVENGESAGQSLLATDIVDDIVMLADTGQNAAEAIRPGDRVTLDNSNLLAMESYHRHQVPPEGYPVWDQFRDDSGEPLYPQRPMLLGPLFAGNTAGGEITGEVDERMILVASLWDREALPWQADWYRRQVEQHARGDDRVRLYYVDHALHGDDPNAVDDPTRVVSYIPVLQQALRELAAWVEHDKAPPASTGYRIDNGQVHVPGTATMRQGLQPVVNLSVNGGERADIQPGDQVTLTGTIETPPGAGVVMDARWDFGQEETAFPVEAGIQPDQTQVTLTTTRTFDRPGTHFVALKGVSRVQGDEKTPYARMENLARVRVVVH